MALPAGFAPINLPKTATDAEVKAATEVSMGSLLGFTCAITPADGVDCVQVLTISGSPSSGGMIITSGGGFSTPSLTFAQLVTAAQATAEATVKAALEALADIGVGNIASVVRSGSTPNFVFTVTFGGTQAGKPQTLFTTPDTFDQGGCTPTTYTVGVAGTGRGLAGKAALLQRTDTGKLYVNGGTLWTPVWKLVTSA